MPTPSRADEAELALLRSGVYGELALGFGPPAEAAPLASPERARTLACALQELGAGAPFAPPAEKVQGLGERHAALFGHTVRGRVCAYETEYGPEGGPFRQPMELSDLGAFFAAFGLRPRPEERDRADHVSCECEFMAFLARKEAFALEREDERMLEQTRKGQRLFLRDHLGRFAAALGTRLGREDPEGFYGALGGALRGFLTAECERLGVRADPEGLRLRPAEDDGVPMACGNCAAAPGGPGEAPGES